MSLPVMGYWFSTGQRRNRKSFIYASLLQLMVLLVLVLLGQPLLEAARGGAGGMTWMAVGLLGMGVTATIVSSYLVIAQRFRDLNVTGWYALIFLPIQLLNYAILYDKASMTLTISVVLAGILNLLLIVFLSVWPGTGGDNTYGPDPRIAW